MFSEEIIRSFQESWISLIDKIPAYLTAVLILSIGIFLSSKAGNFFKNHITKKGSDPLISKFLAQVIRVIFIIILIIFALRVAGLRDLATGLFTAAGASTVILGFAFKDIGENFISGIILTFNRPFNVRDIVSIGDVFGRISSMEFRYTMIKTFDGKNVYIPNSDVIKKPVFNFTENGSFRMDFTVGIDYNSDINLAKKIILEVLNSHNGIIQDEDNMENYVLTDELAVNSIDLKIYFWVYARDYRKDALMIKSDLIEKIKIKLDENGIGIPSNVHELTINNK